MYLMIFYKGIIILFLINILINIVYVFLIGLQYYMHVSLQGWQFSASFLYTGTCILFELDLLVFLVLHSYGYKM